MFAQATQRRSGITLTEILISIMIMGVGMVSLATLFPLGLLRIRDANRMTRSTLLAESAMNDIGSRNLLHKKSFLNPLLNPFSFGTLNGSTTNYDPWISDAAPGANGAIIPNLANGFGLPVAYDPLWRASVPNSNSPNGVGYYGSDARFGSGYQFIRPDSSANGSVASAYGLQRVTNFNPQLTPPFAAVGNSLYPNLSSFGTPNSTIAQIFVSPEDIVFQNKVDSTNTASQNVSTVVPDLSASVNAANANANATPSTTNDWRYTWMFTGHQADEDGTVFEGEIVVFENRPFSFDPTTIYGGGGTAPQAAGETVVEAIFGYSPSAPPYAAGATFGYGQGADKTILIRWPTTTPDPDVKVGSWIADVTYELNPTVVANRFGGGLYPAQRCYWYQITKRSTAADESTGAGLSQPGFRAMTLWIGSPLRAKTQNLSPQPLGTPVPASGWVVNAALVCPYVVNVFPRTVYTR